MITIPTQFNLNNFSINTFSIFFLIATLILFFVVWKEGREDGFDTEKLFDMFLVSMFFGVLLSRVLFAFNYALSAEEFFSHIYKFWVPGFSAVGALIGFTAPVFIFSKIWNWSIYRLLDIFSLGASLSLAIISLSFITMDLRFELLFAFAAWVLLFVLLSKLRNIKIPSGYSFSIFLIASTALKIIFFRDIGNLNFVVALVTLSLVVFIFRWRLSNYGGSFISRIRARVEDEIARQKERIRKS